MVMTIRADSTELVTATISADHDITGDLISVATPGSGDEPDTWYVADVLDVTSANGKHTATYQLLMGPVSGDVSLTPGEYDWIVKVSDSPEVPVRKVGQIVVT